MTKNIVTKSFKNDILDGFINDIDTYYMFYGRQYEYGGGIISDITDSINDVVVNPFLDMLFAKRITPDDITKLIRRKDWQSGITYTQYDHRLPSTDCYVGVTEGSSYYVFKCISNNNGATSSVSPSFNALISQQTVIENQPIDTYYETSDGYQWKYMFSIDSQKLAKFATPLFVPVVRNSIVESSSTSGSIDLVKVEEPGIGYKNHFDGSFSSSDQIYFAGNTRYFALSSQTEVPSSVNGFYTGCIIKITNGAGAGQYREVQDYINSGSARYIVVDRNFDALLDTTTEYSISPKIEILGESDVKCEARAIINSGNGISSVEVLNPGRGYLEAQARVIVSNVISVSNTASLTPIISPPGGHGSNPAEELGSKWLGISVTLQPDENGQIPIGQQFGQLGIIRNPMFDSIVVDLVKLSDKSEGTDGTFLVGEQLIEFSPIKQYFTVTVNAANNIVTSNSSVNVLSIAYPNDRIFIESNNQWFVSSINISASNSSTLVLGKQLPFSDNSANVYISYSNTTATVNEVGFDRITVNNLTPFLNVGSSVIGLSSYAVGKVEGLIHNNTVLQGFDVVNQLSVLRISNLTGELIDDLVMEGENEESFTFYSYANSDHVYVSRIIGEISSNTNFLSSDGQTSLTVTDKYNGQFKKASGSVLYVENHPLVQRDENSSQTKRLIIEF